MDALLRNLRNLNARFQEHKAGNTGEHSAPQMLCVVKADAYGHGAVPLACCLEKQPEVFGFAAATAEEAFALRGAGIRKPILILGYAFPGSFEQLVEKEVRIAVFREDTLPELAKAARRVGRSAKVHIKVDTGMMRIGVQPDETGRSFVKALQGYPELEVEGIFTHFARADERDKTETLRQLGEFLQFAEQAEHTLGRRIPLKHCANSAGTMEISGACLDLARLGIALYGVYPSGEVSRAGEPLQPVLSWHSRLVYVKDVEAGCHISYGGTFTAPGPMRVGTVAVGYGDGYPRSLSNRGYVLIRGRKAPILGRVCMDQLMVDLTGIPDAREEDAVTLLGRDGAERISAEELGELSGRFHYELLCDIGRRVPRVYRKNGEITEITESF